jgi:hypothetical protein
LAVQLCHVPRLCAPKGTTKYIFVLPFNPSADLFCNLSRPFRAEHVRSYVWHPSGSVDGSRKYSPSKRGGWRGRRHPRRPHPARSGLSRSTAQAIAVSESSHSVDGFMPIWHSQNHNKPLACTHTRTVIIAVCRLPAVALHVQVHRVAVIVRPFIRRACGRFLCEMK